MYTISPSDLAAELGLTISRSSIDEETKRAIDSDLLPKLADSGNDPLFYTMWIIIEKEQQAIIGGLCFHGEPDATRSVEVGYGIDDVYCSKGYATEALGGLIDWLKADNRVDTLLAETESTNGASIKVLMKHRFVCADRGDTLLFRLDVSH
jgi:RimJ/RimL family protein N-acetyltransferase